MIFIISAPRSGSTMLERILESHSEILGGPEPHLLTPLAHLGPWAKVDRAPYDHVLAAESQKLFISKLPNAEKDYWDACRAYCDTLYGRYLSTSGKRLCLDKTPAYALILPFLTRVFPDAKYLVLTRHPLATFSSYANSFFDGNYETAQAYNPVLQRYIPALATFLRATDVAHMHIPYEELVSEPWAWVKRIHAFLGVLDEPDTVLYTKKLAAEGLGDPITVDKKDRPTAESIHKWADELRADSAKAAFARELIAQLDPDDLATLGYPVYTLWQPLEEAGGDTVAAKAPAFSLYRYQRKAIVFLRRRAQAGGLLRRILEALRLGCEVLLRD